MLKNEFQMAVSLNLSNQTEKQFLFLKKKGNSDFECEVKDLRGDITLGIRRFSLTVVQEC